MVRIGRTGSKHSAIELVKTGRVRGPGLREWELSLRHHGNNTENGNELMRMGENGNIAIKKVISAHLYYVPAKCRTRC